MYLILKAWLGEDPQPNLVMWLLTHIFTHRWPETAPCPMGVSIADSQHGTLLFPRETEIQRETGVKVFVT